MTRDVSIEQDVSEDTPSALNRRTVLGALSLGLVAAACSVPGGDKGSASEAQSAGGPGQPVGDEIKVALPSRDDTGRKPFDEVPSIAEPGGSGSTGSRTQMPGGGSVPQVGKVQAPRPASTPNSGAPVAPKVAIPGAPAAPKAPAAAAGPEPFVAADLAGRPQSDFILTRLTSGITNERKASITALGTAAFITDQLAKNTADPLVEAKIAAFSTFGVTKQQAFTATEAGKEDKVARTELTLAEYLRKTESESQLFEQMATLWMDHLNVSLVDGDYESLVTDYQETVIRPNVMGKFNVMLQASAKHPAMLTYLDAATNDANDPNGINENYGREILELHTLGKNPQVYDEDDLRKAAFAFCGWTFDMNQDSPTFLDFQFDATKHDAAQDFTVLDFVPGANVGQAVAEALIESLAIHPSTARHIATKMARKFVEDAPSEALLTAMAAEYIAQGTDITSTMLVMFNHPDFIASDGLQMRTPNDVMMAALVSTNAPIPADPASEGAKALRAAMDTLGHECWTYGTPDGFPIGPMAYNNTANRGNCVNSTAGVAGGKLSNEVVADIPRLRGAALTAGDLASDMALRFGLGVLPADHKATVLASIGAADADPAAGLSDTQVQDMAAYLFTHPLFMIR